MSTYDAIVVGLGAMGSATLYQLATRGRRALGIDQFPLGHTFGSSHGLHRLIRRSNYQAGYEPLIARAFELWPQLEQESGRNILNLIGEVTLGGPFEENFRRHFQGDLEREGRRELLDEAALAERFPGFRLYEGMLATYEQQAGFLRPEVAIAAQLELAERHGAEIHRDEHVRGWEADGSGVAVHTSAGSYHAERLIVTAGPFSAELLGNLGLPLQVVRIVNVHFQPERPELWTAENGAPDFILSVPEGQFYGMPSIEGAGVKIGRHDNGEPTTARTIRREIDQTERDYLRNVLDRYMPGASGPISADLTCMYTMTPDEYYVVERHPEQPQVAYGAGFSGTGFKYSCVIGEILADLAIEGETRFDISIFSSARFAAG
ncbi:MAG: N-methyl-L-tryptophan oxidase [Chloroflexi bacterium]|nr:MAG: N-methyl-L-tryptophan oxidase [Chloroflexota bacterium]